MTAAKEYAALDDRDIVTRLREYDPDTDAMQVVRNAADEIERLRATLATWLWLSPERQVR